LSAAMTTPDLNLMARTDVPVTTGDWVWVVGVPEARACWVPPWEWGRWVGL